jgi:hypothetical protein
MGRKRSWQTGTKRQRPIDSGRRPASAWSESGTPLETGAHSGVPATAPAGGSFRRSQFESLRQVAAVANHHLVALLLELVPTPKAQLADRHGLRRCRLVTDYAPSAFPWLGPAEIPPFRRGR